jgi:hypothetical protein
MLPGKETPAMAKKIAFVSSVSLQGAQPTRARDLYVSDWFRKASAYADRVADEWYILSAKYGLLPPDTVISPDDVALSSLSAAERKAWAARVISDLRRHLRLGNHVIFLAGEAYRPGLIDAMHRLGCSVEIPMEGLRIGEQLHWLKEHLR